VVTKEQNNPTAAHAGCKRQLKWVPSAWGYSWANLPYGLQIKWTGPPGWGLGNRPTTCHHKQLTVRKPQLWLQNSQTEWNQPRQWKRINDMRRATWNVCMLYRAGAERDG